MAGSRSGAGSRAVWLTVATAVLMGVLGAACSSSGAKAAPAPPPNPAFVKRGITLTMEPSGNPKAVRLPLAFLACTAAKIPAPQRPAVAAVTNGDKVPGNVEVYIAQAAAACNRPLLLVSLERSLTDPNGGLGLGVGAAPAACASRKALASLLRLDPSKVAANTTNNAAVRALLSSLDGCYPFQAFVDSAMRAGAPSITSAQIACIGTKMTTRSWTAMAANQAGFKVDLLHAAHACVPG